MCGFFVSSKSPLWKIWCFFKTSMTSKTRFLTRSSIFCFFWHMKTVFSKIENNTHLDWVLVTTPKVSAQKTELSNFARRKTFGYFWILWHRQLLVGSFCEFWIYDNFCSTHWNLFIMKISSIFVQPFPKNFERGGPLKSKIWWLWTTEWGVMIWPYDIDLLVYSVNIKTYKKILLKIATANEGPCLTVGAHLTLYGHK